MGKEWREDEDDADADAAGKADEVFVGGDVLILKRVAL